MAHHQHHGLDYEAQLSRSLQSRPTSAHATSMPAISEDEVLAEADEPPDPHFKAAFTKHALPQTIRRQSLLTQALHTDSESHDEESHHAEYFKLPSVASTASSHSVRSVGDFTSDDGHVSPSTRASTPGSPRTIMNVPKIKFPSRQNSNLSSTDSHHESDQPQSEEAKVEAKLGRKRCIMFACGKKDNTPITAKPEPILNTAKKEPEIPKRACTIKFACPFKASKPKLEEPSRSAARHPSPAPQKHTNALGTAFSRRHRDSDATIRNESPTTPKGSSTPLSPSRPKPRRLSSNSDLRRAEACRFHEFASEEEEHEDWTEESTCHRSRLTVDDTLKKEHEIRKLAEEVDEEEAIEREIEQNLSDDDDDDDVFSDLSSDEGFQSDDEEGFAESDDENDSDGDYEWWVPRRTGAASPYVGHDVFRPVTSRTYSDSSLESSDGQISPKARGRKSGKRPMPLSIRSRTPELPDSTDFVCGTLDEDRPQEQAYMRAIAARKASKHKTTPQDIDPTFPISDPEMASDDDEEDVKPSKVHEESDHFMHGRPSDDDEEEEIRGRRMNDTPPKRSTHESPKRLRSPPPLKKSCAGHRSPAPHMLFGGNRSPRKHISPAPGNQLTSPPPSRRGSTTASPAPPSRMGVAFLSTHMSHLTHTASLPRSPHSFFRKRNSSPPPPARAADDDEEDDDDEGSATDRPNDTHRYTRGAIDIAQGLERKRLKRREKFHKQYQRKEEKKERKGGKKRPTPGQGAERMRQVGLECAIYRGTRMLSI